VRIELNLKTLAASAAIFVCGSEGAMSQAPSQTGPRNDLAVTLASGTVVRIRNMVIFQSQNGSGLAVYIETPTPSTDRDRLALEAKEVAGLQLKSPTSGNLSLTSVRVAVCRTSGCLEMREKPQEMFSFVRKSDGTLEAEKPPPAVAVDADDPLMRIANFFIGERREPVCGSNPPQGERIWYEGGDACEWMTPTRGRIVAQRDQQHRVHAVTVNRQTNSEANAHEVLDSLATAFRSFGLSARECEPGSTPAGAVRMWLYEDRKNTLVHISEITPPASPPRLVAVALDNPDAFPRALCH
jgi:hypothetical protein